MRKNTGFTLTELLVVLIILSLSSLAIFTLFSSSTKVYLNMERLSNIQEQARLAMVQMDRVFERWGIGVPYNLSQNATCASYPPREYPPGKASSLCYVIRNDGKEIEFYASLYGIGFVKRISGNIAYVISCRLNSSTSQNCYYVWRGENPYDNDNDPTNGFPYFALSGLSVNNAECINWNFSGVNTNAQLSAILTARNVSFSVNLREGDVITRVPHRVKIYYDETNQTIYLDLQDMASDCNSNERARPIARNITYFSIEDLTQPDKNPVIRVTFNIKNPKTNEEYTFQRVYGRW